MNINQKQETPLTNLFPWSVAIIFSYPKNKDDDRKIRIGEVIGVVAGRFEQNAHIRNFLMHSGPTDDRYLWTGFRLNVQPTARYTELALDRFLDFWKY